tara:strand:+ start:798 stop:1139 length:342 start_codon:yes stop_codon:yes gene_type:complete
MTSRTYTVNDQTFFGFNFDFSTPHRLMLVRDEDSVLAVALDEDRETRNGCNNVLRDAVEEFIRYIEEQAPWMRIMETYKQQGFHGFKVERDGRKLKYVAEEFIVPGKGKLRQG